MIKNNYFNVIDFGSSKIRFSIFDKKKNNKFIETFQVCQNNKETNNFKIIHQAIKRGEKIISSHIENIILTFDTNSIFIINISLSKKIEKKIHIKQLYSSLILELKQIIKTNYSNYEIIHIILTKCIIDETNYYDFPNEKNITDNLKVDLKLICYPKKIISNFIKNFNDININVENIFCTSYLKTLNYTKKLNKNKIAFIEIANKRTSLFVFENKVANLINSVPIGSYHITNDISKIFKINFNEADKIKKSFNKTDTEFSYQNANDVKNSIIIKEILDKNISINQLKEVVLYRVQEIIDLTLNNSVPFYNSQYLESVELFLIGSGSNLFDSNSFYLNDNFNFKSINFYNETDIEICNLAVDFYLDNYEIPLINNKKTGLFEKFFNFFGK